MGYYVGSVPIHAYKQVGVCGEGSGEGEANEEDGGGVFRVGVEEDVSDRGEGCKLEDEESSEEEYFGIHIMVITFLNQ